MYRLKDFSNSFAEQYPEFNLTKKDSEHLIKCVFTHLFESLKREGSLNFTGFFKMIVKIRPSSEINVGTGIIQVPEKKVIKFTASKSWKDSIQD